MGMRTVRLDDEMERVLKQLTQTTGWSVSTALKQGLLALRDHAVRDMQRTPYEVYRRLDLEADTPSRLQPNHTEESSQHFDESIVNDPGRYRPVRYTGSILKMPNTNYAGNTVFIWESEDRRCDFIGNPKICSAALY
jgi:hypothetical protein